MEFSALATGCVKLYEHCPWFTVSLHGVYTNNPQSVADLLHKKFGLKLDEIVMIVNGEESPEILYEWKINEDYHS